MSSISPTQLVKPFRDQSTAAEEARQDFEQALVERDPYLVFLQELPEASEGPA